MGPAEAPKENADSLAGEIGVEGIEALPGRVERYGNAKNRALDVAEYIGDLATHQPMLQRLANRVATCGDYLVFRHYFTVDRVRLHGASLCMKHLLCPLCAIRRGAKALKAYLDRWEVIKAAKTALRPFLVTLTVKNGDDLAERFRHLRDSQHELWKQKHRGRGSVLDAVEGAVWSYEVKRGRKSGKWHPHLHMIALAETMPSESEDNLGELSRTWHGITGDSHMVDVRPISQDDLAAGFMEVFKYAVKFSDQDPEDTFHCYQTLQGKRLIGSAGCFRGVDVGEELTDDIADLADLPFVTLFYRYLAGKGYTLPRMARAA